MQSRIEIRILEIIAANPGICGSDIMRKGKIAAGTIGGYLIRMREKGLVSCETFKAKKPTPGLPKRLNTITKLGETTLKAFKEADALKKTRRKKQRELDEIEVKK